MVDDGGVRTKARKQDVAELLLTYAAVVSRLESDVLGGADTPLTYRQFSILRHVRNRCDSITLLTAQARLSLAATSQSVDYLVKRGLLLRGPHADDRRRIVLSLTPSGERVLGEAQRLIDQVGLALVDAVPEGSLAALQSALPALIEYARGHMVTS